MHAEEGDVVKAGTVLARARHSNACPAGRAGGRSDRSAGADAAPGPQRVAPAGDRAGAQPARRGAGRPVTGAAGRSRGCKASATRRRGAASANRTSTERQSAVQTTSARTDEAREALRLLEAGSRVEDIGTAAAQVKASRAQLALLRHQIELGELKAPVDAVVRSRLLEPGDMATPQKPVFTLALTQPEVGPRLRDRDLTSGKVRPGMAARVTTDSQAACAARARCRSSRRRRSSRRSQSRPRSCGRASSTKSASSWTTRADLLRLGQPVTVQLAAGAVVTDDDGDDRRRGLRKPSRRPGGGSVHGHRRRLVDGPCRRSSRHSSARTAPARRR